MVFLLMHVIFLKFLHVRGVKLACKGSIHMGHARGFNFACEKLNKRMKNQVGSEYKHFLKAHSFS